MDPSILALPYWDYARDTQSGDCFEKDCYISSDAFFGDIQVDPEQNYTVTNGLFAYWPMTEYTKDRFGSTSNLNVDCTNNEYFVPTVASVCKRCCGQGDDCVCDQDDDVFPQFLRSYDDCTPYVARNPDDGLLLDGTYNLLGTQADFDVCTNPSYIKSHMQWQNCVEFERLSCMFYFQKKFLTLLRVHFHPRPSQSLLKRSFALRRNVHWKVSTTLEARLGRVARRNTFNPFTPRLIFVLCAISGPALQRHQMITAFSLLTMPILIAAT